MIQPTNAQLMQQMYNQNMQPAPQPMGGANAVSINIYNPQAYGANGQSGLNAAAPYNYDNSLYNMPQTSAYNNCSPVNNAFQQYIPQTVQQPVPQLVAPAPQVMPSSVLNQPTPEAEPAQKTYTEAQPQPVVAQPVAQEPAQTVAQEVAQPVEVANNAPVAPQVNTDALIAGLQSQDADVKAETINQIAAYAHEAPEVALQIVSEPIMNALVGVINEDTTGLQGPTDAQIKVAEKIAKGDQLTPEENALAEQLSPRDKANKNRIFSLYTLAMIQKLQRDELSQYNETRKANGQEALPEIQVEELIGYNDVVNTIQNDARPEVRVAAIQALQHIAKPADKQKVEAVLQSSLTSKDTAIQEAAQEALAAIPA